MPTFSGNINLESLLGQVVRWINKLFEFFGTYTSKYSKLLVYALLLFVAAKIFKVKLNLGK